MQDADRLVARLRDLPSAAVAYSGGVDSAVVAHAAYLAQRDRAIAITAASPSVATGEIESAAEVARFIGIRHEVISTFEIDDPRYRANPFDRCYFCKSELYSRLREWLDRHRPSADHWTCIVNGANADDLQDHRPGLRAAGEHEVVSPLADCGLTKEQVRAVARGWQLAVADKPSMPCLASRIAYGQQVTPERMQQIDQAERWLRARGYRDVRVRYHEGDLARVEVPLHNLQRLVETDDREQLVRELRQLGFRFVTLDLQGRQSGSLNTLVPIEQMERNTLSFGTGEKL